MEKQDEGDWIGSARVAENARAEWQTYMPIPALQTLAYLAAGDAAGALHALKSVPEFKTGYGKTDTWLLAFINMKLGSKADALDALTQYLGRAVIQTRELNPSYLLKLWKQQETGPQSHTLCFDLPILPAACSWR